MTVTLHKVVKPTWEPCDDGKGVRMIMPDDYVGLTAEREMQAAEQELVNRLYTKTDPDFVKRTILFLANRENGMYPQYRGYWDDWTLHKVTQDLVSKGGVQAKKGDIVLAGRGLSDRTFYSVRLGWNCSGPYGVRPIEVREGSTGDSG